MSAISFVETNGSADVGGGIDVDALATRFLTLGRAAIVGPHGAGKSTLLRAIADRLTARGLPVVRVGLPGSATSAERVAAVHDALVGDEVGANGRATNGRPMNGQAPTVAVAGPVICFDGGEQLTARERRLLPRATRVLITAHRPSRRPSTGWPTLTTLRPTAITLDAVLAALLDDVTPATRTTATAAFTRRRGDVRETLMDLYDAWADGAIDASDGRRQEET